MLINTTDLNNYVHKSTFSMITVQDEITFKKCTKFGWNIFFVFNDYFVCIV